MVYAHSLHPFTPPSTAPVHASRYFHQVPLATTIRKTFVWRLRAFSTFLIQIVSKKKIFRAPIAEMVQIDPKAAPGYVRGKKLGARAAKAASGSSGGAGTQRAAAGNLWATWSPIDRPQPPMVVVLTASLRADCSTGVWRGRLRRSGSICCRGPCRRRWARAATVIDSYGDQAASAAAVPAVAVPAVRPHRLFLLGARSRTSTRLQRTSGRRRKSLCAAGPRGSANFSFACFGQATARAPGSQGGAEAPLAAASGHIWGLWVRGRWPTSQLDLWGQAPTGNRLRA